MDNRTLLGHGTTVMHITSIQATPVRVPRCGTFTSSLGTETHTLAAVVEVQTTGETGIGEISSIWGQRGLGESKIVNDRFAPLLIGRDPFQISELNALMNKEIKGSEPAKAAVDMALFDIVGKTLNTPVYNLLGGLTHERITLSHSLSMGATGEIADRAHELVQQGYTTLKLKVGQDQASDLAALQAVRKRIGHDITIRVDANMAWQNAAQAVSNIQAMEPFDLEMVEQPLPREMLAGLAEVRCRVNVPIMVDESLWTPSDAIECIRANSADVFNVYVSESGGLQAASKVFAIAEAAEIPCIIGSMPELGIGTIAQAHLGFAMRNIGFASDINGIVYHANDIIQEKIDIRDGWLYPPQGPGLGVNLDRAKLEKYRVQ